MNKKWLAIFCLLFLLILRISSKTDKKSVEDMTLFSGGGFDLADETKSNDVKYNVLISSYVFDLQNKITNRVTSGKAETMGLSRQERQRKIDKKYLIGLEKTIFISERMAKYGIRNILDLFFCNPSANDTSYMVICKGDVKSILEYTPPGYPNSADYVDSMMKNAKTFNFFTDNYKTIDLFSRLDSEGRNFNLPYIELTDSGIKITGICLFNKDKMVKKLNIQETRILNMLSNESGEGDLTIQKNPSEYIDYYCKPSRKVVCKKVGGKYLFTINLTFKGDIIANDLYPKSSEDADYRKTIEDMIARKTETMCNNFIYNMQNNYRIDCLELGRIAAAKYGRDTGTDWDKAVSESTIKVTVKVKIDKQGRGDY